MSAVAIAIPFDTLAFVRKLEAVGVPSVQAATKGDVRELGLKLATTKAELQKEVEFAKNETIKWMIGLALAQLTMMAGILVALVRILPGGTLSLSWTIFQAAQVFQS